MRRALGRGLSQLIAEEFESAPREATLDAIVPNPRQPRTVFEASALEELADSIREHGVLQPLVVRPKNESSYELIAGERRLRAARMAGLRTVPIIIRSATNQDSLELAVIENVQREDIGPMERARAYRRLMDEFSLTQEQVSHKVGKARASVANTVRLLKLPDQIQRGLDEGVISEGHAKALLALDTPAQQLAIYDRILEHGLNVRDIERATRAPSSSKPSARAARSPEPIDPNVKALEDALSTYLGSPVKLQKGEVGGRIVVEFYSDDDLERILETLGFSW
ncbi:MAG: ParB family transcriptional regulator, chromosome partitioning protein [Fimbriimonadaceae bacterium]|jgi:ParB family chromosome partitioning protein|nr:ParB family transcriptional regulator, chromosome partitioning protein [Fimbriimonadaceae bacterium]